MSAPRTTKTFRWSLVALFLAIGFLHAFTWWAPLITGDETVRADFVLHGDIRLFSGILPSSLSSLSSTYAFGVSPVHNAMLRFFLTTWGIGIAPLRMLAILCGLAGLALLYGLTRRTMGGWWSCAAVLFFSTSTPYFLTTHTARAEPIILLILLLNVYWWLSPESYLAASLLGILTGISFGIYPSAVYVVLTVLVLAATNREKFLRMYPGLTFWCLGVGVGAVSILRWIDVDQVARYLSLHHFLYHAAWVRDVAFSRHHFNIFRMLNEGLDVMVQGAIPGSTRYPTFIAFLLSALIIQLRQYSKLSSASRAAVGAAAAVWMGYSVLNISHDQAYSLLLFPLWIWQGTTALYAAFYSGLELDDVDILSSILCLAALWLRTHTLAADTLLAFALLLIGVPPRRRAPVPWRKAARFFVMSFGALSAAIILLTDQVRLPRRLAGAAAHHKLFEQEVALLSAEKRIVGPTTLWLYNPHLPLQSVDFLFLGLDADPTAWIIRYRPTLILWPRWATSAFQLYFAMRHPDWTLTKAGSWTLPASYAVDFVGLRLSRRERSR